MTVVQSENAVLRLEEIVIRIRASSDSQVENYD